MTRKLQTWPLSKEAARKQFDLHWCHALVAENITSILASSLLSRPCQDSVRTLSRMTAIIVILVFPPLLSQSLSLQCGCIPVPPCPHHACGIPAALQYFGSHPLSVLRSTSHPQSVLITVRFEKLICASFILHRNDPIIEAA